MNEEAIKQTQEKIKVMQAWCEGKTVQWERYAHEWIDLPENPEPAWDWGNQRYRIKPTPKTRPMRFEDLPGQMFFVRDKGSLEEGVVIPSKCSVHGLEWMTTTHLIRVGWMDLERFYEYSFNLHGPWLPFTVEEK